MGNNYFRFKAFNVEQEHCAMKVSTDACIQGAWTPVNSRVQHALDIGAGTGLLSLMIAQRSKDTTVDAIEIDPHAANQASLNFSKSGWKERLQVIVGDARHFSFGKKFDLIICNPPFFNNSLLGNKKERNIARHNLSLSFDELFELIKANIAPNGYASVLLPVTEHEIWNHVLRKNNWEVFHSLSIIPRIHQPANRIVSLCRPNTYSPPLEEELVIRGRTDHYTPEFTQLLRAFYLNF